MHTPFLSNRLGRWLAVTLLALMSATTAHAQLTGTKAIPGDYASVAAAITALNAQGVGAGGVTFNIAAGYTETFASPTAGAITATGTSANPIVFQKSGTGANPVLTAGVGTSTALDAIISLAGSDYVTFDGLSLAENPTNTTATTQAEFGYALFRASATDGCQNVSISNATITLNKTNTATVGIWGANSTAASATAVTATSAAGSNSNIKLNGNTVANAFVGIYLSGLATTVANADTGNEIGTTAGNVLSGLGGANTNVYGIRGEYQSGLKIENNTITIPAGNTSTTVRGIGTGVALGSGMLGTLRISNNTVTLASATSGTVWGIHQAGTSALTSVSITNNKVQNCVLTSTGAVNYLEDASVATALTTTISGNQILGNSATTTALVTGINRSGGSGTATLSNNVVGAPASGNTVTATDGSFYGIRAGTGTIILSGNSIVNNTFTASGTTGVTMYGYYNFGSPTSETLTNNTITGLSVVGSNAATAHVLAGMYTNTTSSAVKAISGNTIGGLTLGTAGGTASGTLTGIIQFQGTTVTLGQNKVYDLTAYGASTVSGLMLNSGTTITAVNNLIGSLSAPNATSLTAISGVQVSGGTTANLYFNTIYLNGSSNGATFGTSGIYLNSTSTTLDARNNIVVNKSTAIGAGGYTAALRRVSGTAGTAPANLATTTNNNLYYAGTPSATNLLYVEGTTTATNAQQTLSAYKIFVSARESSSVTEDVPFLSTTGPAAPFLHINPAVATQVESSGTPVSGITTDFDGDTRNASTPDLGADEGTFTPLDLTGPVIAFTPLVSTASTANRTLVVSITDQSGVSTTTAPRLFYRKGTAGAFISALATSVSSGAYTFTFDYAALGGVAVADVIQYYVVAQDVPGNVSTSPLGGTYTTTPASVNQYTILSALSGVYYVGTSPSPAPTRTYATLTAAAAAYSNSGMSGAVTFLLLDNAYSATTGETFPVIFFNNPDASATNTLLIKPNTGALPVVTAAGSALILAGTRYVTIDGSNTVGGTTRNLTLTNTTLTASTYSLGLLSQTGIAQANLFATVRNVNVTGGGATANATFGIVLGGADNDNVTLQNNSVQGVTIGIQAAGTTNTSAGGLDNLVITGNVVGPTTATAGANINQTGILVASAISPEVSANEVQNIVNPTATFAANMTGILLQDVKTGIVTRNSVHNLTYTGTSTAKLYGISTLTSTFNTAANASAIRFDNNLVYALNSTATSSSWNTSGINNNGGYGDQYYYNTVYLSGQLSNGAAGSAAFSNGNGITSTAATNIDVRNNIFSIIGGTGLAATPLYAHYSTLTAYTGSTLNNNDLYVTTGATGVAAVGHLGTAASPTGDYATLALWRTATSQEANSVSTDPQFVQTATSPYNLTPGAAALDRAATPIAGVTVDYTGATRGTTPDIGAYEFTPPACQAVNGLAFASITSTSAGVSFTAPTGGSAANSYTVTYTPAGGTATTVTPNPTGSPVALTGLTANTVYTVTVTTNCTGATSPSATGTFRTACLSPTYATLPASEDFETTWLSRCDTREVPTANWLNTPTTGNNSWRRDDDGAAANWTSPAGGAFTPAGQGSAHSARFHAYFAPNGAVGTLDFYVDLSAAGTKRLSFGYVNQSPDGSKVEILLSTDGGATFSTTPLLTVTTSAAFSTKTVDLTATSATSVIRFKATSDFGSYDIGVDNVQVRVLPAIDLAATALATPTSTQGCYGSAETVAVTVSNQGTQTLDFSVNPATVTATVTTPGGPQTLTGSITTGTLASGATQNVTLTPTLNMTAVGTYTFAITATVTGDGNPANDALTPAPTRTVVAPVAGTLAPASTTICVSGTAALALTGAANGSIQYQSSTDNVTFADVAGATSAAYTTPVLTSTTYYRAQVRCGTAVATSNVSTITVTNPLVTGTNTPLSICAGSTATLTATAGTGSNVRFFDVATGGTALATTTPGSYTTGALTAPATYYAEAYSASSSVGGLADNAASNGTFAQATATDYPLGFAVTQAGTLASVDVYPTATGALTIRLYRTTGGQPAGTTTAVAGSDVTITVTAAQVGTRVTVPLNYVLAAGDYRLSNFAGALGRFSSYSGSYPLTSGALTVKGSYNAATSTSYSNTTYNSFFNLTFTSECAGATRTAIQVNVTPPATASFTAATGSSCGTSAYQLTGTVGGSATGGTYTSSGTGTFSPNATTLTATYTPSAADVAAGSVTITLTSAGSTPCPATTATFALSISPAPVATFSYPAATTYCAGSTSTVSPTLGAGASAGTYSSTTGLTINATTGVITLATSTAGTYTVTNTVAASGPCAAVSAATTVTITPATSAAFSYGGGTFCVSGTNPTATVTGTAGGTFSSATGLTINATTGAITLSSSTPGTYTVTYTVAGTCGTSSTQSVTITTAPVATFSYGTPATFCVSGTTNPAPSFGTGASGGVFSSTTGLTLNATTGAITLASSTPGTYTVTNSIAASGGCAAATATTTVTITAAPRATFSYASTAGCAGSTAAVTPTLGTGASAGTYSSTTGLVLNATTGAITLATSTAGTYTVTNTVAAAGGCAAATATATFTVNPRPATPTFTAVYSGPTTTLTSNATTGNQWYLNGVAIAGATGQTYVVNGTPAQYGSYTVVVTNNNGCASLPSTVLVITAARNGIAGASLKLYPNPTPSGQVTLELTGYRLATQLTVLDPLGRVVASQVLPANAGTATHALNLTGVTTGVYLLRLSNADGVETRRLVRE